MKSLLNLTNDQTGDKKALNFILVCFGKAEKMQEAVRRLQKSFRARMKAQSVSLYNLFDLDRVYAHPERLSKTNMLTFRGISGHDNDKEYIGYFDCRDNEKLYRHLFHTQKMPFPILIPPDPPYYTKNRLLQLLSASSEDADGTPGEESLIEDFSVKYHYETLDDDNAYAIIRHSINSVCLEEDLTEPLSFFDSIIREMDADFPDVFQSAYISYQHPELAILHEKVYHSDYDRCALDRFVLGLEWSVYFSGRILQSADRAALRGLADTAAVYPYENGLQYKAREDIRQFRNSTRNTLSRALGERLIPAFGLNCWWDVYPHAQTYAMYPPQTVSVYFDKFCPKNPEIVFSYNLEPEKLDEYASVHGLNREDRMIQFRKKSEDQSEAGPLRKADS